VNDNLSNSSHCKGSKSMGGKGNGGKGKGSLYKDSDDFPAPADTIRHALDATDVIKNALTSGSNIRAILVLSGVGVLNLLPLSLVHPSNCFTVGYGAAVSSMSLTMILSFGITVPRTAPELLLFASFVYGI
jgi:hypothetical protein